MSNDRHSACQYEFSVFGMPDNSHSEDRVRLAGIFTRVLIDAFPVIRKPEGELQAPAQYSSDQWKLWKKEDVADTVSDMFIGAILVL